jgi:DNA polymerase I
MPRLLLLDGHSNLYRAFFAIKGGLAAPDGTPTNATYGFLRMLHRLLREQKPSHVGVAFDVGGETFRTRMDERYKATRPPMPEELRAQVPTTQEALRLLGVHVVAIPDVEADDVIGTLARRGAAEGFEVVIASSDKDLMQLVSDPLVRMWHTRLERSLDEHGVAEVFGVPPRQVGEVLAIMGDASDNVPGCPGIGEKGAFELIRRWGSVAEAYAHLDEVTPPRLQKALAAHRDEVALSAELIRIRTDLELGVDLHALGAGSPDVPALAGLYRRLGFTSLIAELPAAPILTGGVAVSNARELSPDELAARLAASQAWGLAMGQGELCAAKDNEVLITRASPDDLARILGPHLAGQWAFDSKRMLARLRDAAPDEVHPPKDVMLAGYLLAPGEAMDLAAICGRAAVPSPVGGNLVDEAEAVARLIGPLEQVLHADGLDAVFEKIEMPLVPVLEAMERTGILLDVKVLADISERLTRSLAELERDIHKEAGGPFNINSPQQLAEVLYARRGLPVLRKTGKTKAPSTDAEVLRELAARGFALPGLILEYREQAKLKSTYIDALPLQVGADGRIHTSFNQAVAATGRLSSSNPNLQNIPVRNQAGREVRRAFVAAPGAVLLVADYSQIELRVLAHMADEPTLQQAFAAGEDIHTATAALVFGMAPELIGPEQRRAAKTINFGLIYGMGAFSLARDLGVSTGEAQRFIDAYFARLPRVREFLESVKEQARRTGRVSTLFGRVRHISGLDAPNQQQRGNAERQAINAPVQGTAADLIKLAMIELHEKLGARKGQAKMLLQVHDELVVEVESQAAEWARAAISSAMEGVASLSVPLVVDIGEGRSWAEAKG